MKLFFIRIHALFIAFIFYIVKPFGVLIKKISKQKVILFSERGYDAQDNAYVLFKYAKEHNKNFKSLFLIKKNCCLDTISTEDRVNYGSLKHIFLLSRANVIASTHYLLFIPCNIATNHLTRLFKLSPKIVFLSHGISLAHYPIFTYPDFKVDIFATTMNKEHEYMLNNYGQSDGVIQKLGFARFDRLFNSRQNPDSYKLKKILILPTWRIWLENDPDFKGTTYFKEWSKVLSNGKLLDFCRDNKIKVVFCLHPQCSKFLDYFEVFFNDVIEIFDGTKSKNVSIQDLLVDSDLLITDYSSVYLDYAFMKKPLIHYIFDADEFYVHHYKKGNLNFEEDYFGPWVNNCEDLVKLVTTMSYTDWFNEYSNFIDRAFDGIDGSNCERTMNRIESIL